MAGQSLSMKQQAEHELEVFNLKKEIQQLEDVVVELRSKAFGLQIENRVMASKNEDLKEQVSVLRAAVKGLTRGDR